MTDHPLRLMYGCLGVLVVVAIVLVLVGLALDWSEVSHDDSAWTAHELEPLRKAGWL